MYDRDDDDDDDDESEIDDDTEDEIDESSAQGYRKTNMNKYEEDNDEEVDEEGEEDDDDDDDDDDDNDEEYESDKVEEVHNAVRSFSSRATSNVDTSREYKKPQRVEHIPLYERLQKQIEEESLSNSNGDTQERRQDARRKRNRSEQSDSIDGKAPLKRANKNAPSEMRSDRPVRRLRVTANNSVKKSLDPRFTDFSGALNEQLFSKNYSFLDEYRDSEIKILSKAVKSTKGEDEKAELKSELLKMKQQSKERRLSRQVTERLEQMKSVEKHKLKQGKQPFYLKRSVVQTIGLEER